MTAVLMLSVLIPKDHITALVNLNILEMDAAVLVSVLRLTPSLQL